MDSGEAGDLGPSVLLAVVEALSLAPGGVTLLPLLEVDDIAGGNLRSPGPATLGSVEVRLLEGSESS